LSCGALRPDERQSGVVARLAALLDQLHDYGAAMAGYKEELAAFKVRGSGSRAVSCGVAR
jgi:hypothetical protein